VPPTDRRAATQATKLHPFSRQQKHWCTELKRFCGHPCFSVWIFCAATANRFGSDNGKSGSGEHVLNLPIRVYALSTVSNVHLPVANERVFRLNSTDPVIVDVLYQQIDFSNVEPHLPLKCRKEGFRYCMRFNQEPCAAFQRPGD